MAYLFQNHWLVAEGAAATGIAALLEKKFIKPESNVVLIVSGNNIGASTFIAIKERFLYN
ncbi:hypothetical protein [Desulfolucanica intricata]|uniref:hypothetical protein n=1 Tax=Desulfolucanica intricata TaxID=1285191 RepID=UPI00135208D4|nr:hypothetical protein [Desulfolucanica intricata]